jgi:cytochrome c biogenesis protein CcdA
MIVPLGVIGGVRGQARLRFKGKSFRRKVDGSQEMIAGALLVGGEIGTVRLPCSCGKSGD